MTISDSRFIPSLALLYFFNRPFFFLEKEKFIFFLNILFFKLPIFPIYILTYDLDQRCKKRHHLKQCRFCVIYTFI